MTNIFGIYASSFSSCPGGRHLVPIILPLSVRFKNNRLKRRNKADQFHSGRRPPVRCAEMKNDVALTPRHTSRQILSYDGRSLSESLLFLFLHKIYNTSGHDRYNCNCNHISHCLFSFSSLPYAYAFLFLITTPITTAAATPSTATAAVAVSFVIPVPPLHPLSILIRQLIP